MTGNRMIFPRPGVLLDPQGQPRVSAVRWATLVDGDKALKVKNQDGSIEEFPISHLSQSPRTDTIKFESDGNSYTIRPIRESDGIWLSTLRTPIPVQTLNKLITEGNKAVAESLTAYSLDDSPYVVGLVYETPEGRFSRVEGDWEPLAASDETFLGSNVFGLDIDPSKADDFIKLFDKNHVSVADLSKYESADSEPEEAPEQSDE